jgi:hypothetical protein
MTGDALPAANASRPWRPARAAVYTRLDAGIAELRQRLGVAGTCRRVVGNHQLAEYLEVTGYAQAARWVYEQALNPGDEPPQPLLTPPRSVRFFS